MKAIWSLFLIAVAAVLIVVVRAFALTYVQERRAEHMLSAVTQLGVGRIPDGHALEALPGYQGPISSQRETGLGGYYHTIGFDNLELSRLHLAHYKRFTVILSFDDGVLVEKRAIFFVDHDCRVTMEERLPQPSETGSPHTVSNHFSTSPKGDSTPVAVGTITDDITYSARSEDWQFNLKSLTAFGGCNDGRSILPGLTN